METSAKSLVNASDKPAAIQELWDKKCINVIPALIYLYLTGDDQTKNSAGSLLYKLCQEIKIPINVPGLSDNNFVPKTDVTTKKYIIKPPKKQTNTIKTLTYAFHIYALKCDSLPEQDLNDAAELIHQILLTKTYVMPPRFFLDVLTFVLLIIEVPDNDIAYQIIDETLKEAEERSDSDVIASVHSILELFPKSNE